MAVAYARGLCLVCAASKYIEPGDRSAARVRTRERAMLRCIEVFFRELLQYFYTRRTTAEFWMFDFIGCFAPLVRVYSLVYVWSVVSEGRFK